MDIPIALLRAARLALDLSREELAAEAGVSVRTIGSFERNSGVKIETQRKIQTALERRGVTFIYKDKAKGFGLLMPKNWP
ncbi:helix-turn-helix domain-containing protein [Brucella anthropi]|jgi:transcriptional regulator with XRE-family HTH domain|uniref:helix-turn-helix domain-containing protein n=1 Tax=Brucella anthropi TaxID=529 RepID=UPI00058A0BEA|nr:helix-turn-helix transcriptional regulator [Brucella anthropi]KAB2733276.1 helix-turn-helix transcriptional regulator [Brucella anthropi]KAB2747594.1 helix-turn-helix transcriptional regulator [Brucella anthropi]KAB2775741.1 helix-turn-helix transcriptional regulator [Brucella anthropi]QQC25412.1 helix-turn-helix transcriptional regulator [Brucella anthropi]